MSETEHLADKPTIFNAKVSAAGIGLGPILTASKLKQQKYLWDALRYGRYVDLSMNQIRRMDMTDRGCSDLDSIEVANFQENEISELDLKNISSFKNLVALNVSNNKIKTIFNINYLPLLRKLDLSHNELTSLRFLRNFDVTSQIEELNLSYNKLLSRTSVAELCQMENLRILDITNNKFYLDLQMEAFCILACPNLVELNGQPVTTTVRADVEAWVTQTKEGKEILNYMRDAIIALESRGNSLLSKLAAADESEDQSELAIKQAISAASPTTRSPILLAEEERLAIENRISGSWGTGSRISSPVGNIVQAAHSNGEQIASMQSGGSTDEARARYETSARRALGVQRSILLLEWFSGLATHRPSTDLPVPERSFEPLKLSTLKSWAKFKNASMSAWKREMDFRSKAISLYRNKLKSIKEAADRCANENERHFDKYMKSIEIQETAHLSYVQTSKERKLQERSFANKERNGNIDNAEFSPRGNGKILVDPDTGAIIVSGRNNGLHKAAQPPIVELNDPVLLERARRVSTTALQMELHNNTEDIRILNNFNLQEGHNEAPVIQEDDSSYIPPSNDIYVQVRSNPTHPAHPQSILTPVPDANSAMSPPSKSARIQPASTYQNQRSRSRTPTGNKNGISQPIRLTETTKKLRSGSPETMKKTTQSFDGPKPRLANSLNPQYGKASTVNLKVLPSPSKGQNSSSNANGGGSGRLKVSQLRARH